MKPLDAIRKFLTILHPEFGKVGNLIVYENGLIVSRPQRQEHSAYCRQIARDYEKGITKWIL